MKKIALSVFLVSLTSFLFFFSCSTNEDPIKSSQQEQSVNSTSPTKNSVNARVAATRCAINGIGGTSATVSPGSTVVYTYSNSLGSVPSIVWSVVNVVPAGSVTLISNSGTSVSVSFAANFQSCTLIVAGTGSPNGQYDCNTFLNLTANTGGGGNTGGGTGGNTVTCNARINSIWCSPGSAGYNAMINVDVFATNPFSNTASVLIQWDPANFTGFQVAGGLYNLGPNATALLPSQFDINANINFPSGFYVPIIVKYTDLVTNATCTVSLNPLVTGGCNRAPM
ncbi:MAG: hypothetical protein HOP30_21445 [Cyclobacteriaceae bacterium]|nr:hypothetical protein [Cyclobacteriaceae bacterium]